NTSPCFSDRRYVSTQVSTRPTSSRDCERTAGGVGHLSSISVSTQQPCAEHPRVSARSTILSSVLTGVTCGVLLLLGVLVGLLSTLNAAWMTRYWDAGHPVPILAVTGLLVFLAVLRSEERRVGKACGLRWEMAVV